MTGHVLEMDSRHRYWCVAEGHDAEPCHGVIFGSVTTILSKAVPKDLSWYGMQRGVIGVKGLLRLNKYDLASMSPVEIVDALKREHLTVNDHRDQAADGGTVVHRALEDYIERGIIPSAMAVPEQKRASMIGLARFMLDYRPKFLASEVRTLSLEHRYAGTFDVLANIHAEIYTVPKRGGGEYLKLRPSDKTLFALIDLKNSKYVYPTSHFPQLEAYEGARIEAGEEPTQVRAVLWVNGEGDYELVPSTATFADFLALKRSAEVLGRLDKSWSRPRKARA